MATKKVSPIAAPRIDHRILPIRGERVMLDHDLAELYGVSTKALNQAVKRNAERFPEDFMFRLEAREVEALNRSQSVTGSQRHRDPRFPPYAFTEHGAIQAANVLSSPRAAEMSVHVVRAFVRMRGVLATHKALARKLAALEQRIDTQDETIFEILDAIKKLMTPPEPVPKQRPIGFVHPKEQ